MEPQPSTLSEYLPQELYRHIAIQLDPRKDVASLLSLSLVSRALQIEGQRVLFSMGPDINVEALSDIEDLSYNPDKYPDDPYAHAAKIGGTYMKFLESIIAKPKSLAGYVVKYNHFSTRFGGPNIDVVLMSALPLMHNLKSLSMNLRFLTYSLGALSKINSFQLRTLSITPPSRASSALTTFLRSQMALTHITILPGENTMMDSVDSFDGVFPSLISVQTSHFAFWERLARSNNIKAVHLWGYKEVPEEGATAIRKVKYLRFGKCADPETWGIYLDTIQDEDILSKVLSLPSGADLDIEVVRMHMNGDIHKTVYNFTERLGQLRILIAWEGVACHTSQSISLFFRRVAAIAFSRCSRLLYVIVPNHDSDKSAYLYRRSAQKAMGAGPVMEEHEFSWDMEAQAGPDWWVEWEGIISGNSALSLRTPGLVADMSDKYSPDGLYSSVNAMPHSQ